MGFKTTQSGVQGVLHQITRPRPSLFYLPYRNSQKVSSILVCLYVEKVSVFLLTFCSNGSSGNARGGNTRACPSSRDYTRAIPPVRARGFTPFSHERKSESGL